MKHMKALIAFYLFWALALNCRGQVSGSAENSSRQSDAGSPAARHGEQQCPVAGSVVSATTGEPIHKASVKLFRLAEDSGRAIRGTYGATTDAVGHFQALVDAGRYAISVTRTGYAQQTVGRLGSARPAAVLPLACGTEISGLRVLMTPQGLITGTVVDEDNEPVANAIVEAFNDRPVLAAGRARAAGSARTNDLGKYRIFGIGAGRYYVRARFPDAAETVTVSTQEKQQASYVPIYYPGTNHASAATSIQVMSGQESEADITMSKVPTVHISGKVVSDYRVSGPLIVAYPGEHPSWDPGERRGVVADDKTGRWGMDGLQPGPYTLVCDRIDRGIRLGARQVVNVGTKNIDNIEVTLNRYPDLAGKVTVEGGGKAPSGIRIALQPRQALASIGYAAALINTEGEFLLTAISPDLSDIRVSNLPSGYFVKSVIFSGREVSESGVELGLGGSHRVDIVISLNGATVEGSVSDEDGEPSPGAIVALVPDSGHRQLKSRYYTATADQNGRFTTSGIHPGEYTAVAWDSAESLDYAAPDALEVADKQGQTLKLEAGGQKAVQLKALSSSTLLP
ncbi:MAG TPA: carboxypeptidase regulatory-like domain-containing protein [Candidatus Angelobacter sp.]|nr:carboxypeptidase regulatory-like domain-containing protein [Candidatus Angelobacter sp.]